MLLQHLSSNSVTHLTAIVNHCKMSLNQVNPHLSPTPITPKIANNLNIREKKWTTIFISRTKSGRTMI